MNYVNLYLHSPASLYDAIERLKEKPAGLPIIFLRPPLEPFLAFIG